MKKNSVLLLVVCILAGCAHKYDLTLTNGQRISGVSKPVFHKDSAEYFFTDARGHKMAVRASHIVLIEPAGSKPFENKSETPFNSSGQK